MNIYVLFARLSPKFGNVKRQLCIFFLYIYIYICILYIFFFSAKLGIMQLRIVFFFGGSLCDSMTIYLLYK